MTKQPITQEMYIDAWIGDDTDAKIDAFTIPFSDRLASEVLHGSWMDVGYSDEYAGIKEQFLRHAIKAARLLKDLKARHVKGFDPAYLTICFHYRLVTPLSTYRPKPDAKIVRIYLRSPEIPVSILAHIQNQLGEVTRLARQHRSAAEAAVEPAVEEISKALTVVAELPQEAPVMETELPGRTGQLHIALRQAALDAARRHAAEDTTCETGGVLIGKFITEQNGDVTVLITSILRAQETIRQTSSLTFTPATWAGIWQVLDRHPLYSDERVWKMVGWYHTHPSFGIFLSAFDLAIHENFFSGANHIALVIDPLRRQHGFFGWNQEHTRVEKIGRQAVSLSDQQVRQRYLPELEELPPGEIG